MKVVDQNKNRRNGFLLTECLVSLGIIITIIGFSLANFQKLQSRDYILLNTVKEMTYYIKYVQMQSMLGGIKEQARPYIHIKNSKYSYVIGTKNLIEKSYPQDIRIINGLGTIRFDRTGLPNDVTQVILEDKVSGKQGKIYIAVQTGRVRWEI